MFKMKKALCLVMVFVFALAAALAGCGAKNAPEEKPAVNADTTSATDIKESAPAPAPSEKPIEIVMLKSYIVQGKQEQAVIDAIQEKILEDLNLNIKFKFITFTDQVETLQKLMLMSASGEQLDMFTISTVAFNDIISKPGLLAPLDEAISKYGSNLKKVIPQETFERFEVDGKTICIPNNSGTLIQEGIIIRQDWLDKLGLEIPTSIEELENVMEAFKTRDPDGNGKNDTVPLAVMENYLNLNFSPAVTRLAPSTFTMPGIWDCAESDGTVKPTFLNPDYADMVKLIKKWYEKGWLSKDFLVTSKEQFDEMFKMGKAGIYARTWKNIEYEVEMQKADPNVKLSYVPPLSGPKGKVALGRYKTNQMAMVPSFSKNLDTVIKILDWSVMNEENYMLTLYGIEGVTYKKAGSIKIDAPTIEERGETLYSGIMNNIEVLDWIKYQAVVSDKYIEVEKYVNEPDCDVIYGDTAGMAMVLDEFNSVKAQCDTIRKEWLTKMAIGEISIDKYSDFINEWTSKGGNIYIKEKTEQYKKIKGIK